MFIDVLANDSDPNGDTLTVVEVSAPAHGTAVAAAAAGTVEYTPEPDFHGTDRFTYVVGDGSGLTARAAVEGRAVGQFLGWCEAGASGCATSRRSTLAAYIRTHPGSAPTVKQHLAAIRMLGDWLVVNQVLPVNPAAAVRGPKHVVSKGATPVLSPAEARKLLETIDTGALVGIRDRALLSVMLYTGPRRPSTPTSRRAGSMSRRWRSSRPSTRRRGG